MRSVLVYEFITGGGCWFFGDELPTGSLLAEGTAMRDALAADLSAIPNIESVRICHDVRLPIPHGPKLLLDVIYEGADPFAEVSLLGSGEIAGILIAPESSNKLLKFSQLFEAFGIQLLSPSSQVIELCSNKQLTCEHLNARGIRTPRGVSFREMPELLAWEFWPAVLKPIDGCGSQSVQMVESAAELAACDLSSATGWRLEQFHPGTPVSVSLLAGPRGFVALQPCTQNLSADGRFTYRGCTTPIEPHLAARAQRLALAVAATLPPTKGYLGIDMVLGSTENGSQDVVIEINPRLTTSYLVLRQACEQNLAETMLKWAAGEPIKLKLTWRHDSIEYSVPCQ